MMMIAVSECLRYVRSIVRGERGQTLAEYSLLVTLIGVGVTVSAIVVFRTQLAVGFDAMTLCLQNGC